MKIKTKDLLTLEELTKDELSKIIDLAIKLKKDLKKGKKPTSSKKQNPGNDFSKAFHPNSC